MDYRKLAQAIVNSKDYTVTEKLELLAELREKLAAGQAKPVAN